MARLAKTKKSKTLKGQIPLDANRVDLPLSKKAGGIAILTDSITSGFNLTKLENQLQHTIDDFPLGLTAKITISA